MKAGQWDPQQKKVVINDIPIPSPAPHQFLVKIAAASLCHSDLMMSLRPDYPVTIGHEGVGHIVSFSSSITEQITPSNQVNSANQANPAASHGFAIGDAIGFNYFTGCCFTCDGCQVHNLRCEKGRQKLQGFVADGFFAEYAVVDVINAVKLPSTLETKRASPLFCAGITAFHSVEGCELRSGEWIAVVGCGGLGQYALQYARAMGLNTIALDISDTQLAMAKKLGADATFNSRTHTTYLAEIKKLTDGKGCHAAAVYSGSNAAYAGALDLLRTGGLLMVVGIPPQGFEFVNAFDLTTGRYRIKAESTGIPQRMKRAVDFTGVHCIQPEVEYRRLEDLPEMVRDMEMGKAEKRQVVVF